MKSDTDSYFWPSYVDLMTALFAIGLVLFVLSYYYLSSEREKFQIDAEKFQIDAEKYQRLLEIEKSVEQLQDPEYFMYQPEYKRHVLRQQVRFPIGSSEIDPAYYSFLEKAGHKLAGLIKELQQAREENIKYLVVIEGMASRDAYPLNYELSYQRALALYRFWQARGILFESDECEVILAGSGIGGVGRFGGDDEHRNQRFLIQVIPKVGDRPLVFD